MTDRTHQNVSDLQEILRTRFAKSGDVGASLVKALDDNGDNAISLEEMDGYPRKVLPHDIRRIEKVLPTMAQF